MNSDLSGGINRQEFDYDVCIVGTGRVGLPLALSFIEQGLSVVGIDKDPQLRAAVNSGSMPFKEPGYDDLVSSGKLRVVDSPEVISQAANVIVTVGTPLHNHIETDLSQIQNVLKELHEYLRQDQLLCLRSTVAPGTTTYVKKWLERSTDFVIGENLFLAFCPERIAEGKAYEELHSLAQIVGTIDEMSGARAEALFKTLTKTVFRTDFVSAELVKLFNNIARYIHFAVANQFALIADTFDANIYEIRRMANHDYPRSQIAMPGFTAGTCLRKDFGMINEWSPYPDMLLSAWKMNEFIPAFLVTHLKKRVDLHGKKVAVLGYTFKMDTDDVRDSLAPKLLRYIERELPSEVRLSDHHLSYPAFADGRQMVSNLPVDEALQGADCVFIATNHSGYAETLKLFSKENPSAWVADLWNVAGVDKIFYQARELSEELR